MGVKYSAMTAGLWYLQREFQNGIKGDILQGPDYSEGRRDEWGQSGDTGNGIVRLR